jgi:pimeloyl-ACP methyl ester carboxylesterase
MIGAASRLEEDQAPGEASEELPGLNDTALDKYVSVGGLRLHYLEYTGNGQPIVLLHGLASSSRIWHMVASILAPGFRVLAFDQRGHGLSGKPSSGYDFPTVARDLHAFLAELRVDRPVIVGHSWGAHVALEYAATYPERVAGIVLVDGGFSEWSSKPDRTWERIEREMAPPDLTHLTREELIEEVRDTEWRPFWNEHVEVTLVSLFEVDESGRVRPRLRRENHMQILRAIWGHHPTKLCGKVQCPVLFIAAVQQGGGSGAGAMAEKRESICRMNDLLPDCKVLWFEETEHDIPLHRPAEMAAAIVSLVGTGVSGRMGGANRRATNHQLDLPPMWRARPDHKLDSSSGC